jgi:Mn-dependent DtxR family transcriptional regulator
MALEDKAGSPSAEKESIIERWLTDFLGYERGEVVGYADQLRDCFTDDMLRRMDRGLRQLGGRP